MAGAGRGRARITPGLACDRAARPWTTAQGCVPGTMVAQVSGADYCAQTRPELGRKHAGRDHPTGRMAVGRHQVSCAVPRRGSRAWRDSRQAASGARRRGGTVRAASERRWPLVRSSAWTGYCDGGCATPTNAGGSSRCGSRSCRRSSRLQNRQFCAILHRRTHQPRSAPSRQGEWNLADQRSDHGQRLRLVLGCYAISAVMGVIVGWAEWWCLPHRTVDLHTWRSSTRPRLGYVRRPQARPINDHRRA
jgi:hypothetical protein